MRQAMDTPSLRSGIQPCLLPGFQRGRTPLAGLVLALAFFFTTGLLAQQQKPNEYQVKATYLYNFGRFVKWPGTVPAAKGDSFSVCVIGRDPFGSILDSTLAGESLDGKPVVLRRIAKPQEAGECRILFIS